MIQSGVPEIHEIISGAVLCHIAGSLDADFVAPPPLQPMRMPSVVAPRLALRSLADMARISRTPHQKATDAGVIIGSTPLP